MFARLCPFSKGQGWGCQIEATNALQLIIGCIYRSPNSSDQNNAFLFDVLRTFSETTNCCLVGDFNYPRVDWSNHGCPDCDSAFIEAIFDSGLHQHVTCPTRLNPDHILDLVLTGDERAIVTLAVDAPLGNSDHCSILFDMNFAAGTCCVDCWVMLTGMAS